MFRNFTVGQRRYLVIALVLFVIGVGATAARTVKQYQVPGPPHPDNKGMCDFHNGMYFPTRAMMKGVSPYGQEYADSYPVARQIPFFAPSILAFHIPIVMLPLDVGEVLFFAFSVLLVLAIGVLLAEATGIRRWDFVVGMAVVLLFSRAGHITLYDGYFTFELVLATFLAIHWGQSRPWLAALCLAVVACKPTYILPLGFLMLARGNVKALVIGAILSIVSTGIPMLWLAYHEGEGDIGKGVVVLQEHIATTQEIHRSQIDESPVHSWTRIDTLAVVAKWTGNDPEDLTHLIVMAGMLIPPMILLHRRRRAGIDDGLTGTTGAIILTAVVVSIYHQSYDALLLAAPLAGLVAMVGTGWSGQPNWRKLLIGLLILAPLYSYFSSRVFLGQLGIDHLNARFFTSINGVCLLILFIMVLWVGIVEKRTAETT